MIESHRGAGRRALASVAAVGLATLVLAGCKAGKDDRPPEQIWNEVCATCHAADGSGMRHKLGRTVDMRTPQWQSSITDDEIRATIVDGKLGERGKRMPAFGDRFDDAQLDGLVEYLRTQIGGQKR